MFINWMALWNIYRVFGITVFFLAFVLHCIGKERKVKGFQKIAKLLLIAWSIIGILKPVYPKSFITKLNRITNIQSNNVVL